MSALQAILAAPIPDGAKLLLVLLLERGGTLTASYAAIDRDLGGTGLARATSRKVAALGAGGWVRIDRTQGGHIQLSLHKPENGMRPQNGRPHTAKPYLDPPEMGMCALGGRGVASSNSHDLTDEPPTSSGAVSAAAQQRLEDITEQPQEQGLEDSTATAQSPTSHQGADPPHVGVDVGSGDGSEGRAAPSPRGGLPAGGRAGGGQLTIVAAPPAPSKPAKPPRIPRGWSCSPDELDAMKRISRALWEAKSAAGMPVGAKPSRVTKTGSAPFLARHRELVADGEPDPAGLIAAVVRAKVKAQSERDDSEHHRAGSYATAATICRDRYWEANLAAGRTLIERDNKPAKALEPIDTGPVAGPMPTDLAAVQAAQKATLTMLEAGQRKARRARL